MSTKACPDCPPPVTQLHNMQFIILILRVQIPPLGPGERKGHKKLCVHDVIHQTLIELMKRLKHGQKKLMD